MNSFAQQCITLRKKDYSLLDIVRATGRAKSSIYPYIKDIPLSEKKRAHIRAANKAHLLSIAASRKGVSARDFKTFSHWTKETVFLVSHLMFDGELTRTTCSYNNRSRALVRRVEMTMKKIYAFKPKRYKHIITGVMRVSYYNVALGTYLQEKSNELFSVAPMLPRELQREVLRAFFDDEGCMDFRPTRNVRQIRGYQKNVAILRLISDLLLNFGIGSRVQKPNEVIIVGQKNLKAFHKEIGFSRGVRINGNRSNSIWKQHLEKRNILQKAIASYTNVN